MTAGPPATDKPDVPGLGLLPAVPAGVAEHSQRLPGPDQAGQRPDRLSRRLHHAGLDERRQGRLGQALRAARRRGLRHRRRQHPAGPVAHRARRDGRPASQTGRADDRHQQPVRRLQCRDRRRDRGGHHEDRRRPCARSCRRPRSCCWAFCPARTSISAGASPTSTRLIAKLDDGQAVRFLDMSDQFQTSLGKVKPELYVGDQLHPARAGYQVWADAMQPLFDAMLKTPLTPAQRPRKRRPGPCTPARRAGRRPGPARPTGSRSPMERPDLLAAGIRPGGEGCQYPQTIAIDARQRQLSAVRHGCRRHLPLGRRRQDVHVRRHGLLRHRLLRLRD